MEDNRGKTCFLDLTETIECSDGVIFHVWECSECGRTHEELNGEYDYCPYCGALVVHHYRPLSAIS